MPKKKRPELSEEERTKRLKEASREVEADESGQEFQRAFKAIASPVKRERATTRKS